VIYLDTSAMVKLVVSEPESPELINWLNANSEQSFVTSVVGHIELNRAAGRLGPSATTAAQRISGAIDTFVLTDTIANLAATVGPSELRTLDAIHLATAYVHRSLLAAVCVYDRRLAHAAQTLRLPVAAPGS
jgi:predicted nucleic acid-binding protein